MRWNGAVKRLSRWLTGEPCYYDRELPRGNSLYVDIRRYLPRLTIETAFDVGANVGQSALQMVRELPTASVYSFEPCSSAYAQLVQSLIGIDRVKCFCLALGSKPSLGKVVISPSGSACNSVELVDQTDKAGPDVVEVSSLTQFCREHQIASIGYLKIDTEGADLQVLQGGEEMLAAEAIDVVQVEAGMVKDNGRHVSFSLFDQFFSQFDYRLFGIYEQCEEWLLKKPYLRRANLVYISNRVVGAY